MISLERQVRIAAGLLVLIGLLFAHFVNHWFIGLSAFVGAGLVFAGITDFCGMGLLLAKLPWNQPAGRRNQQPCHPWTGSQTGTLPNCSPPMIDSAG